MIRSQSRRKAPRQKIDKLNRRVSTYSCPYECSQHLRDYVDFKISFLPELPKSYRDCRVQMSPRKGSCRRDREIEETTDEKVKVGIDFFVLDVVQIPPHTNSVGQEKYPHELEENDSYFLAPQSLRQPRYLLFYLLLLLVRYINHIYLLSK